MKIILSDYALTDIYESISYPILYLEVEATGELDEVVDEIREREGQMPFFDDSVEYDDTAWYDFYAKVNLETEELDSLSAITFSQDEDNKDLTYELPVDAEDVMKQINKQLKEYDTSLTDIRAEYLKEMDYE